MAKRTNNDLQNTTLKSKYWATRVQQNSWGELICSGILGWTHLLRNTGVNSFAPESWGELICSGIFFKTICLISFIKEFVRHINAKSLKSNHLPKYIVTYRSSHVIEGQIISRDRRNDRMTNGSFAISPTNTLLI